MIRALRWGSDATRGEPAELATLPPAAELPDGACYWIDACDPTTEEEELILGRLVPVHPLTREDAEGPCHHRGPLLPKVEGFPDYLFVLTDPLPGPVADTPPGKAPPTRAPRDHLAAVLTAKALVTLRSSELDCVNRAWDRAAKRADPARRGPDSLLHAVLDAMVDDYAPILEALAERLDTLEAKLFRRPTSRVLTQLLAMRREVALMRKTLDSELAVVTRLSRNEFDLIDARESTYYRDVSDHLTRYAALAEQSQDTISDLMHLHLAANSNRLNEVMKVLTMTSTVVLPMTLVAGIYGMNFNQLPGQHDPFGFWEAVGAMALLGVAAIGYFAWRGWLRLPLVKRARRP